MDDLAQQGDVNKTSFLNVSLRIQTFYKIISLRCAFTEEKALMHVMFEGLICFVH